MIFVLAFFWLATAIVGVLFRVTVYAFLYTALAFWWLFMWSLRFTIWLGRLLLAVVGVGGRSGEAKGSA